MRREFGTDGAYRDLALLRFNPLKTYTFYPPGVRRRTFFYAFFLLGAPGFVILASVRGGTPDTVELLALALLAALIAGLVSQRSANRVLLGTEELVIRAEGQEFTVRLFDIEDSFLAASLDEVDAVPLPGGHYPMEFETHDRDIVVLVLRDNTLSRSTAERQDGVTTKVVSFNVARPRRFLAFLKMRA